MVTRLESSRAAYVAQQRNAVEWLTALPAAAWELPSRLDGWTVRELGYHVTDMTGAVVRALEQGPIREKALTIAAYTSAWPSAAAEIAQRDRDNASGVDRDGVLANAATAKADLLAAIDAVSDEVVVAARRGPIRV